MSTKEWAKRIRLIDTQGLDKNTVRNMWLMIYAMMGGTVWTTVTTGVAYSGFWKAIGASDLVYGLICSFPYITCGMQFLASYILERTLKRKKIYMIASMIQRMVWIPFALVPIFVPMQQPMLRLWACSLLALVSATMASMVNVAFYSILNDVVPEKTRGRYLGMRTMLSTIVGSIVGIFIGIILDSLPGMKGYMVVFLIAAFFGIADNICYLLMRMPPMRPTPRKTGAWRMLKNVLQDKEYMRVVIFCTAWLFTVQIASPFCYVYLLDVVKMSNLQVTLMAQTVNNLALIFFAPVWGKAIDRFGSKPVMYIGCIVCAFYPLLHAFVGASSLWVVPLAYFVCGLGWTPYEMGSQNLFMRMSGKENTTMYTAVFFMFTQMIGLGLGVAVGGYLLDHILCDLESLNLRVGSVAMGRYNFLFLLCGLGRLLSTILLVPGIREPGAQPSGNVIAAIPAAIGSFIKRKK